MEIRDLEFRGINREHLGLYFEELGAKQATDSFPYIYIGDAWSAQILSEEMITITSTFKVNAVKVRFSAVDAAALEELLKRYRHKTTRIGG